MTLVFGYSLNKVRGQLGSAKSHSWGSKMGSLALGLASAVPRYS